MHRDPLQYLTDLPTSSQLKLFSLWFGWNSHISCDFFLYFLWKYLLTVCLNFYIRPPYLQLHRYQVKRLFLLPNQITHLQSTYHLYVLFKTLVLLSFLSLRSWSTYSMSDLLLVATQILSTQTLSITLITHPPPPLPPYPHLIYFLYSNCNNSCTSFDLCLFSH